MLSDVLKRLIVAAMIAYGARSAATHSTTPINWDRVPPAQPDVLPPPATDTRTVVLP